VSLREPTRFYWVSHIGRALGRGGQVTGWFGRIVTAFLVFPINWGEGHGGNEAKDHLHGLIQADGLASSRNWLANQQKGISFGKMKWNIFFLLWIISCLSWGETVESTPKFSQELKGKAADGDADAQYQLGDCYFFGLGVKRDMVEGVSWYRKAAQAGQMKAQFNLGGCFHEGMGVEPDLMEAIRWWRKSAGQDFAPAEISIGDCYIFGKGLSQDEQEGVRWFRKAAAQNYPAAQHRLGNCYYHGQGVRKDLAQAIQWYRKAAAQGYQASQRALRELGDEGAD